jgi:hypothetical protein
MEHTEYHFKPKYIASPTTRCSFCKEFVWSVAKKGGYQCSGNNTDSFIVRCLVDLLI